MLLVSFRSIQEHVQNMSWTFEQKGRWFCQLQYSAKMRLWHLTHRIRAEHGKTSEFWSKHATKSARPAPIQNVKNVWLPLFILTESCLSFETLWQWQKLPTLWMDIFHKNMHKGPKRNHSYFTTCTTLQMVNHELCYEQWFDKYCSQHHDISKTNV